MTIKDIYKLIKKLAPGAVSVKKLNELAATSVAIDANIFIYKWHSIGVKNSKGVLINHIQGMVYRTKMLLDANITPIWVFDGAPPELKGETIQERKRRRDNGGGVRVQFTIYDECKELLDSMGVMWMNAPSEAEAQCAYLCKLGRVDYVMTDDIDALVFGAPKLISRLDSKKLAEVIDLKIVLEELKLSHDDFVKLCVLLGTDYNKRILPPVRALKAVREGLDVTSDLMKPGLAAYEEFKNPKVEAVMVRRGVIDKEKLRAVLTKYEITEKKIANILK